MAGHTVLLENPGNDGPILTRLRHRLGSCRCITVEERNEGGQNDGQKRPSLEVAVRHGVD